VSLDRRHDHRKRLPENFPVSLYPRDLNDGGPPIHGNATDLTMGGIGIVLCEEIDAGLQSEVWTVAFSVPDNNGRQLDVRFNALITHGRAHGPEFHYGLKFTDIGAAQATSARAALRQFLLSDLRELWRGNPLLQAPSVAAR
jgi:hypothetical protein